MPLLKSVKLTWTNPIQTFLAIRILAIQQRFQKHVKHLRKTTLKTRRLKK